MTKDNNLKNILDKMGFISLGTYNDMSSYVLGREDKEKWENNGMKNLKRNSFIILIVTLFVLFLVLK